MSRLLCKAVKKDGTACKRHPIKGREYCYAHMEKNEENSFWYVLYNFFTNNKKFVVIVAIIGLSSSILDIPPNIKWIKEKFSYRNLTTFSLKDSNAITPTTCIVAGWIIEEGTGVPIEQAQIILPASRDSGTTNMEGYFRFMTHGEVFQRVDATIRHPDYEYKIVGLTLSEENRISLTRKR